MTPQEIAEKGLILRVTVGSTAHGLHLTGTDDRDEMGVCIEPPERMLGLQNFELIETIEYELKARIDTSPLPRVPDFKRIDQLLVRLYLESWQHQSQKVRGKMASIE